MSPAGDVLQQRSLTVGPFQENCYLLWEEGGDGVLVDPGDEWQRIAKMVRDSQCNLRAIWLTHAHLDHVGAVAGIKRVWDVPIFLHELDLRLYRSTDRQAAAYGIPFELPPDPEMGLSDGDVLNVGKFNFRVMHTPGHSPGHVVFIGDDRIVGGDLLFQGSIGRTDLPLSNPADMVRSLELISVLRGDLVVYPGHGPLTTIAEEVENNPFLNGDARVLGGR